MQVKTRPVNMDRLLSADMLDHYGIGSVRDLFGIEVELEGIKIQTEKAEIMKWWTNHIDNSLRVQKVGAQATEYVLKKPLSYKDTLQAIDSLFIYLNTNPGTKVFESYRTSIHVHVNCMQETTRTIMNYITLAIIFDELLVSQNGEHRAGNNFCLRARDAEGQVADLIQSVQTYGSFYNVHANHRYSSTNVASLMKFGTIEFRSLECTTDKARLVQWINILQNLKVQARTFNDPRDIIAKFSRKGPLGFMIACLGENYAKYAAVPGATNMLRNGMRLAQDFAFCTDWRLPTAADLANPKKKSYNKYGLQPVIAELGGPGAGWVNPAAGWPQPHPAEWAVPAGGLGQAVAQQPAHALPIEEDDDDEHDLNDIFEEINEDDDDD